MQYTGNLLKMKSEWHQPVQYFLELDGNRIAMNNLIGQPLHIHYDNQINCISCGAKTKKSYGQGFCYKCFITKPEADQCIVKPELCRAHEGISRDMEWSKSHCLQDHFVYLAVSSGLKVGVTRATQIPTRWIDQGARKAIKLAQTPYRQLAGAIEVALKAHLDDKTNWRKMLKDEYDDTIDLVEEKQKAWEALSADLQQYVLDDDDVMHLDYPVQQYPEKVKSVKLDKLPDIEGTLLGIKGQYLLLDGDRVMNIRAHNGYKVTISL